MALPWYGGSQDRVTSCKCKERNKASFEKLLQQFEVDTWCRPKVRSSPIEQIPRHCNKNTSDLKASKSRFHPDGTCIKGYPDAA